MSNIQLKDSNNTKLYPVTKSQNVQFDNGQNLDEKLASFKTTVTWEDIENKPTPADIGAADSAHTHNYAGSSTAGGAATSSLACTGNSATATKLQTGRTLTIGSSSKTFNGSANVTWSLAEIGVGTLSSLQTTNKATIVAAINELFQSVSSGKSSIAQAITSKGVSASASDTFSSLSTKIKNIPVKKYDTGEILKEGTHFEVTRTTTFETNYNYASQNSLTGDIIASSGKYVYTKYVGTHNGSSGTHVLLYEWTNGAYKYISSCKDFTTYELTDFYNKVGGTYYCGPTNEYGGTYKIYDFATNKSNTFSETMSCPKVIYNGTKTYFVYGKITPPSAPPAEGYPPMPGRNEISINSLSGVTYTELGTALIPSPNTVDFKSYAMDDNYLYFCMYENFSYAYYGRMSLSTYEISSDFPFYSHSNTIDYLETMRIVDGHLIITNPNGIIIAPTSNLSNYSTQTYSLGTILMLLKNGVVYDNNNLYIINHDNNTIIKYIKATRKFDTSMQISITSSFNTIAVENNTKFGSGAIVNTIVEPIEIKLK